MPLAREGVGVAGCHYPCRSMKVLLRNPRRELELSGPTTVEALLGRLEINPESVLVICGDTLVTRDAELADADTVEIRPVISGGATR